MKLRGKSTLDVKLIMVLSVLLPAGACTWAYPWQKPVTAAREGDVADELASTEKKEMPKVKLTRTEQQLYDRYHPMTGQATGLSDQSRDVESRLGYK